MAFALFAPGAKIRLCLPQNKAFNKLTGVLGQFNHEREMWEVDLDGAKSGHLKNGLPSRQLVHQRNLEILRIPTETVSFWILRYEDHTAMDQAARLPRDCDMRGRGALEKVTRVSVGSATRPLLLHRAQRRSIVCCKATDGENDEICDAEHPRSAARHHDNELQLGVRWLAGPVHSAGEICEAYHVQSVDV